MISSQLFGLLLFRLFFKKLFFSVYSFIPTRNIRVPLDYIMGPRGPRSNIKFVKKGGKITQLSALMTVNMRHIRVTTDIGNRMELIMSEYHILETA